MNSTMGNEIIEKLIDLLDHDFQDISTECGIALYNICEVQKSKHLLRVLRIDNNAKLLAYYQVIVLNVPVWLKLGIHGHSDVDLLKASLGFYQLCFELASLDQLSIPEANYSKLMSSETNEALESCEFVFANPDLRGANEQLIRALCSDMLKRYCEPSDRFVFS